jgi:hypothetical protein
VALHHRIGNNYASIYPRSCGGIKTICGPFTGGQYGTADMTGAFSLSEEVPGGQYAPVNDGSQQHTSHDLLGLRQARRRQQVRAVLHSLCPEGMNFMQRRLPQQA